MIDLNFFQFFVLAVACFRLTHLVVFDKITEGFRAPFFDEKEEVNEEGQVEVYLVPKQKGLKKWIGELLSCYWCTGIWSSIFLYVFYFYVPEVVAPVIVILAVSGLAALFETFVQYYTN